MGRDGSECGVVWWFGHWRMELRRWRERFDDDRIEPC
jgi:hypothetical protein